jgi:hypothetical protein
MLQSAAALAWEPAANRRGIVIGGSVHLRLLAVARNALSLVRPAAQPANTQVTREARTMRGNIFVFPFIVE